MNLVDLEFNSLVISEDLSRSGSAKQFEERLKASIQQIGLAEPLKVAHLPSGKYVVLDGVMRLKAIQSIRERDPAAFPKIPAYVMDYDRRYELRYQTDIYQDLLPSQLAGLVEHLHKTEHIRKTDIAGYIGISPSTLRNYTGVWRLLQRDGLFTKVVELMDVGVIPSSNPYAWLRLTPAGVRYVLEQYFADNNETAEPWLEQRIVDARRGKALRFTLNFVEAATDALPTEYYREGEELRNVKRDLGLRRAQPKREVHRSSQNGVATDVLPMDYHTSSDESENGADSHSVARDASAPAVADEVTRHLSRVSRRSPDPVLRTAARSFQAYLK